VYFLRHRIRLIVCGNSVMPEPKYRIILTGYAGNKGEYYVEMDLSKRFKISREKARELLQGAPTTVRENLTTDQATKYKTVIDATGASCEVENMMFNISGLSLEEQN